MNLYYITCNIVIILFRIFFHHVYFISWKEHSVKINTLGTNDSLTAPAVLKGLIYFVTEDISGNGAGC